MAAVAARRLKMLGVAGNDYVCVHTIVSSTTFRHHSGRYHAPRLGTRQPRVAAAGCYRLVDADYERRAMAVSSNLHPLGFDEITPKTLATADDDVGVAQERIDGAPIPQQIIHQPPAALLRRRRTRHAMDRRPLQRRTHHPQLRSHLNGITRHRAAGADEQNGTAAAAASTARRRVDSAGRPSLSRLIGSRSGRCVICRTPRNHPDRVCGALATRRHPVVPI
jgi:hypothetical protein